MARDLKSATSKLSGLAARSDWRPTDRANPWRTSGNTTERGQSHIPGK